MATTKWILDPTHSELQFKVKHLMISNVSGSFKNFRAEVETEENDFSKARVVLTAEMASVFTNNEQRDNHLRTSDFFAVDNHPQLTFRSTRVEKLDNDTFTLLGELTLKGITKPVTLRVDFSGVTNDPWGNERAGFTVSGKLNRKDWGVNYNALLETGGVALSEEVKINAEIQVVKQVETVIA
ncbi:MAG TPA: YceI family protein [Flavisolibacter sp.]|jgi:polyisoprenoid-binding protein YceI|nr:YceI family protein [Flavisolibacter sp.]